MQYVSTPWWSTVHYLLMTLVSHSTAHDVAALGSAQGLIQSIDGHIPSLSCLESFYFLFKILLQKSVVSWAVTSSNFQEKMDSWEFHSFVRFYLSFVDFADLIPQSLSNFVDPNL